MSIAAVSPANLVGPGELTGARALSPTLAPPAVAGAEAAAGETPQFSEVLGKAIGQVNDLLTAADRQAQLVATGDAQNLHEAMIAMSEADLALQITMRVTQKAIAAYQEISRMQI